DRRVLHRRAATGVRPAIQGRTGSRRFTMKPVVSEQRFNEWLNDLQRRPSPAPLLIETGRVVEVADGIAVVSGLKQALADELLVFASGVRGMVLDVEPERLGVILLGPGEHIRLGEEVYR